MRTEVELLHQFTEWAKDTKEIRAALLTSSRVDQHAPLDFLSDYDIEMCVSDLDQFRHNDDWSRPLGEIMVRWPFKPRTTAFQNWITRLLLFQDGNRIDFQITDNLNIPPIHSDYGYRILIDKDNIFSEIPEPTYSAYNINKPSQEEYDILVHEFWWDATYVPKYLWRDELPFAKRMMGQAIHDTYLRTIIEWYIGLQHNWSVNSGVCGRYFRQFLDAETWAAFQMTFAGAKIEDNWKAFFHAISLFSKLGKIIGTELGYAYPLKIEHNMMQYYQMIRYTSRDESLEARVQNESNQ
ncbi:MAG: aminoglycoside 6-adenylyltransferase [Desulfobulbaceae bacterium]|nr:aminoglycoside 6-adenylyltransferase [Desulfobulbaceae bacterium]